MIKVQENFSILNALLLEWLRWYEVRDENLQHRVILIFISAVSSVYSLFLISALAFLGTYSPIPVYVCFLIFYCSSVFLSRFNVIYSHMLLITMLVQISYSVQIFGGEYAILRYYFPAVLFPFTVLAERTVKVRTVVYTLAPLILYLYFSRQKSLGLLHTEFYFPSEVEKFIVVANVVFPFIFTVLPFLIVLGLKRSMETRYYDSVKRRLSEQNIIGLGKIYRGATEKIEAPLRKLKKTLLKTSDDSQGARDLISLKAEVELTTDLVNSLRYFSRCHLNEDVTEILVSEFILNFKRIAELQIDSGCQVSVVNYSESDESKFCAKPAQIIQVLIDLNNYFTRSQPESDTVVKIRDENSIVQVHMQVLCKNEVQAGQESEWYFMAIRKYLSDFKADFVASVGVKSASVVMKFQKEIAGH